MRESALFLLGLLVAVSVDVARLLVYADLCARISFALDGMYGADRPKRGDAMGFTGEIPASMDPFFRHAYRKITVDIWQQYDPVPRSIYECDAISETRISIRRSLYRSVSKLYVFRRKFFETADERNEERGMHYKNKRKRCYKKYVW